MATTPFRTIVGTTGASGANGFTGLCAAHSTAITSAVAGLTGLTGFVATSVNISNTFINQDSNGGILEMISAINYITTT
jgi:hypothetical protein